MAEVRFEGRAVAITGAGSGLGRAYAMEIARRGGMVVVNDLGGAVAGGGASITPADEVVAAIRASGGQAVASHDDVASPAGGRNIIAAALDNFGRIDAVIANAGTMRFGAFEDLTADDLTALLSVHVNGSWNVAQAAWPHMKAAGYGRIVFTASSTGLFGTRAMAAYGAAKGGVTGLMNVLAVEGADHGILCNAIMPNAFTRMTASIGESDLGDNPWAREVYSSFDPQFGAGLATYLASAACTTSHGLYSSLGGRIGHCFIGVTQGFQGSRTEPLSADEIAEQWDRIRDRNRGFVVPDDIKDEFRYVVEGGAQ